MDLQAHLNDILTFVDTWEESWGRYDRHPSLIVDGGAVREALRSYTERLRGNYPFFHPRYAGQMLKPPHPAAIVGYLAAQFINPNNHALDGGPPTAEMEKEVVRELTAMFHLPVETLGHLTTSGTIANLEALWIARELDPSKKIAFSQEAHYTHGRMCQVLGVESVAVPVEDKGRLDLDALEKVLQTGRIGTVVVTAGTTGLGAVDPIADVLALCRQYGARIHVDAAYGGFFSLLAWDDEDPHLTSSVQAHFRAIASCDSVVIDPHKHGLQPYGCGCVLFRDPGVGRFYKHDSPYTYFTSDDLHLGEISLECSRAGAAAGALWFTLRVLPLEVNAGLGPALKACRRAAQSWDDLLSASPLFQPYITPELDIVTFFPIPEALRATAIDESSQELFERSMDDEHDPVFLSVLRVESRRLRVRMPGLLEDHPATRILRSVLMKPEQEHYVDHLHRRMEALAEALRVRVS